MPPVAPLIFTSGEESVDSEEESTAAETCFVCPGDSDDVDEYDLQGLLGMITGMPAGKSIPGGDGGGSDIEAAQGDACSRLPPPDQRCAKPTAHYTRPHNLRNRTANLTQQQRCHLQSRAPRRRWLPRTTPRRHLPRCLDSPPPSKCALPRRTQLLAADLTTAPLTAASRAVA